ncbi:MAG: nitroreductase family protein [Bacteroidales bacterium]|nr:nitroreductase family protein [Bacteroidales bacterium]
MSNPLFDHKTIRAYTSEPIAQTSVDRMLQAAIRGSNTGNMQLYSIVLTTDPEVKKALAPAHFNQPMVTAAPLVATVCVDVNRMTKWCEQSNADKAFFNFETFITATLDATIAAQNMTLAAEQDGLGICYLGTTTYNPDIIIDALSLPRGVFPVVTLTIGHPAANPGLTERLPQEAIAHAEKYHDYSADDITRLHAEKEANPENQEFVKENSKQNLAQVFAEVRYPRQNSEIFSAKLIDALRKQGFMN